MINNRRPRDDYKYSVDMVGMSSAGIGQVSVDGKYYLVFVPPSSSMAITSPLGSPLPAFEEVVFYANCLAYDHELPTYIRPVVGKRKALIKPVGEGRSKIINDSYYDCLNMAYTSICDIRFGPLGYVNFRYPGFSTPVDIPYTKRYGSVAKELSLYGMGLRQLDPLSEYSCYYRVLESITNSNGKEWIKENIGRIKIYDFGFLELKQEMSWEKRGINIFSVYKKRAISRLAELIVKLKGKDIAAYFYNENRCGIVHGKTSIKVYDFGPTIEEIAKDLYILKLLARIAIEDKAKFTGRK